MTNVARMQHGGARAGAGRKKLDRFSYVPHSVREPHAAAHPMHITMRAVAGLPSFRVWSVFVVLLMQMRRLRDAAFQIVHFSLQSNHVHFIVEADDRETVGRKMRGFSVSFAKRVNMILGRHGPLWRDRFYCRDITTTREMHRVLAYVFGNAKRHGAIPRDARVYDPFSSAWAFDGFGVELELPPEQFRWLPPKPRTALLDYEWVVHGFVPL